MESLNFSSNIIKLCDYIINTVGSNDQSEGELSSYLRTLKYICYGQSENRNSFTILSPEEMLASLIRVENVESLFSMNPQACYNTIDSLLNYSYLTSELYKVLKLLIPYAVKVNSEHKLLIIKKLFDHKNFPLIPLDLIEDVIMLDTTQLELLIIKLYSSHLNIENSLDRILLWNSVEIKHWVSWCSRSSILFRKLTSIMNVLLLSVKNKKVFIMIIQDFIHNVFFLCNRDGIDIVRLYPLKLHSLVGFMSLGADRLTTAQNIYYFANIISEQLMILRAENPFEALIIITHFENKWQNYLT